MIVDCFSFCGELDLLDIRLHELADVVDYFVLAEAPVTHSGLPKPLYYKQHQGRFRQYKEQIIHLVVEDMPITAEEIRMAQAFTDGHWATVTGPNWTRERYQRDSMMKVLSQFGPNDIIILGEADEIVRADVVRCLEEKLRPGVTAVDQSLHSYYLNWVCTNMSWRGTKIFRKKYMTTLSQDRSFTPHVAVIMNGGWCFSYMGGVDAIQNKIKSHACQEMNQPEILENIQNHLIAGEDGLGRLYEYKIVPMGHRFPEYVLKHLDQFREWIY